MAPHVADSRGFEVAWAALETALAATADGLLNGPRPGADLLDEALDEVSGLRQPRAALWPRLEERRGCWAPLMLSTAHVLRAGSTGGVWRSFAAMAVAVFDGWALKTVPIMEHVLSAGVAAWQVEEYDLAFGLPDEDARPSDK